MSAAAARVRATAGALRWRLDPARSELSLAGTVMGAPWLDGLLRGLAGTMVLDPEEPPGSSFELAGAGAGLYVAEPFLNSSLRLADLLGEEVRLAGMLVAGGALAGEYEARVRHNLAGLRSPLRMAVELSRWQALGAGDARGGVRVSLSARQLDGLERLSLHLEAVLDE